MTRHRELQEWVDEMGRLCEPDSIVLIDGSEEKKDRLTQEAVQMGEITLLNQEELHGCLHLRATVNDVPRTEDLTFICSTLGASAGSTNNWMSPEYSYGGVGEISKRSMRGRKTYVIPCSVGLVSPPYSEVGIELTHCIDVVNIQLMPDIGSSGVKQLGGGNLDCGHDVGLVALRSQLQAAKQLSAQPPANLDTTADGKWRREWINIFALLDLSRRIIRASAKRPVAERVLLRTEAYNALREAQKLADAVTHAHPSSEGATSPEALYGIYL